jgi:5-methylcytosine-specific restriction endonuclease McrBC regulatory subunit McrC
MSKQEVAAAMAFFQASKDLQLLKQTLQIIRPMASRAVGTYERTQRDVPEPIDLQPANEPATQQEALRITRSIKDFRELQTLARVIGMRVEQLQSDDPADR